MAAVCRPGTFEQELMTIGSIMMGSRVAQRSKALHFSAGGVTIDPELTGRDWESCRAVHLLGFGRGRRSL
jgi:hypothetical protein